MNARGLAVAGFALLVGCTGERLEDEWQITLDQLADLPLEVVDSFPADGSDGIAFKIEPYALMTRPMNPEERAGAVGLIRDASTGSEVLAHSDLDSDFMGLTLRPAEELSRGRAYSLDLSVSPTEAAFATSEPDGWPFNMSSDLRMISFGGNRTHAQQLNDTFVPGEYPLWVLQVRGLPDPAAVEGTAVTIDLEYAPGRIDEEDPPYLLRKEYGYVGRLLDVAVAPDGSINHRQSGVFLPLWSAENVVLLYLEDVHLAGQLYLGGGSVEIPAFTITGVLGTRWLLQLREAGPAWRNAVGVMKLDVDTNGNGVPDAATFSLTTSPTPLLAEQIDL